MEFTEGIKVMTKLEVLYEDNHVIVVVKPVNVLSQADATHDLDLLTMVKEYVKEKYHKKGDAYIGLVHRLDRPVGGVMVFARTSKAANRLNEQIKNHKVKKEYLAIVHGIIESDGNFVDYLLKKDDGNTVVSPKGKKSELTYEVLKVDKKDNLSLVKVHLLTGRHHQIRVQFKSHNHPLLGDMRYGKQEKTGLCLYAYQLSFYHPISRELMTFKKMPSDKIWTRFK